MTSDPDEITTDVDPSWVASIRTGERSPESDAGLEASPAVEPSSTGGDWTEVEPAWDPEATVGVTDGLLERIRQEIGTAAPPTPSPKAPRVEASPVHASPIPTPPIPAPSPASPPPSIPATSPEAGVEQAASTTVRWEPRQRLAATAPVNQTSVIAPSTAPGIDRTKVAIAAIAAIALVVVAWLFIGPRGGDDAPPPIDSVPTSDSATAPADPDVGAGG